VKSKAQDDDFQEVKRYRSISLIIPRRQRRSRLNHSQHPHLSKCFFKAAITRNFFTPHITTDMDMETTVMENTSSELEAGGYQ
jgi:hypothetical protein